MEVGRVGDLQMGMTALRASRWSAIGSIAVAEEKRSKKERPEGSMCLPLVRSQLYETDNQKGLTRPAFSWKWCVIRPEPVTSSQNAV